MSFDDSNRACVIMSYKLLVLIVTIQKFVGINLKQIKPQAVEN